MTKWLFLATLCFAVCEAELSRHFLNCEGNMNYYWFFLRRCCKSDQLPNNCECFDISAWTDFTNTLYHRPHCPKDVGVTFFYYDRQNVNTSYTIKAGAENIARTPFDGKRRTVIIVHGFTDFGPSPWMLAMKDQLLKMGDMNVILVNWQKGASPPNYYQAVANTRTVGAMIGRLIQDLHIHGRAGFWNFHLVGHSLGSHIMGYAGKEVFRLTGHKVYRITGLDPAGPAFEHFTHFVRLDKEDAIFVDVIHTDAEDLISSGFGINSPIGHVDFFPNGGQHQPGCPAETYGIFSMLSFEDEMATGACSHGRATELFTYSISACSYTSTSSDGVACPMGYHAKPSCRGELFPTTTGKAPFC